jgi:uncharacterized cupredoxin-like copper-binding protein
MGFAVLTASVALFSASAAAAGQNAKVVTVTAGKPTEFGFILSTKTVPVGAVTFKVTNRGQLPHDFKICKQGGTANACTGAVTALLSPGQSATLNYTFKASGSFEYLCTVPGHAAAGMKGDIKVS